MTSEQERAHAGANLLDRVEPGWFHGINLESLDIGSTTMCALGQTYGTYTEGLRKLEGREESLKMWDHGFTGAGPTLNQAWRDEVTRRLAEVPELIPA